MKSVTTLIGEYKQPFDKDYWAEKKSIELGVNVNEILNDWKFKADFASQKGSIFHSFVENYLFNKIFPFPETQTIEHLGSVENMLKCKGQVNLLIELFKKFYDDSFGKLIPVRAELVVGDEELGVCGMVDQIFWNEKSQKLEIWDWKTNKEFKSDDHPNGKYKKLLHPFSHLWENHLNEYSIQVSLYRLMLEDEIGLETHGGFLCHIGPEGPAKIYPTKDLRQHLRVYLQNNREDFDIFDIKN
jgi:hypothetical protein